jgi:hypothetical protein
MTVDLADWHGEYPSLAKHYARLLERAPFADTVPPAAALAGNQDPHAAVTSLPG